MPIPAPITGRARGTFRGITAELREGHFDDLAVNTLWLMPIVQNTRGFFTIGEGVLGTGYHGYWPISSSALEPTLGTEADLRELLDEAHRRRMRVLLDVVPNHVHEEHSFWREHPGWFQGVPGSCTCGSAACPWESTLERCWFAPYLPDLDWNVPEAAEAVTASTVEWLERFPFDGLRIDAVPMMPRGATRAIVDRARRRVAAGSSALVILGEVFTGPDGFEMLRYYLGPVGLSSTFHFPLFWALRGAFVTEDLPVGGVATVLAASANAFAGSGATLTTFVGSHDVPRLASVAAGDQAGAFDALPFSTDPVAWARVRLAFDALYTLPGSPMLYQGDELGMPGTGDPATRLPLAARSSLPAESVSTLRHVQSLSKLRACAPSLRRGTIEVVHASREVLAFTREDPASGDRALIVLSRSPSEAVRAPVPAAFRGPHREYFHGTTTSLSDELTIAAGATRTAVVWLPSESPCRPP